MGRTPPELGYARCWVEDSGYMLWRDWAFESDFGQPLPHAVALPTEGQMFIGKKDMRWDTPSREYNPYFSETLLPDFLSINADEPQSILRFVNMYGLLTSKNLRSAKGIPGTERTSFLGGSLKDHRYVFRGDILEEVKKLILEAQTAFSLARTLESGFKDEDDLRDRLSDKYEFSGQRLISLRTKKGIELQQICWQDLGVSNVEQIELAFRWLTSLMNTRLAEFRVTVQGGTTQGIGRPRLVSRIAPSCLMGVIWHLIAHNSQGGGNMRQCAKCGRWFQYRSAKAETCSGACKTSRSRARRQVDDSGA